MDEAVFPDGSVFFVREGEGLETADTGPNSWEALYLDASGTFVLVRSIRLLDGKKHPEAIQEIHPELMGLNDEALALREQRLSEVHRAARLTQAEAGRWLLEKRVAAPLRALLTPVAVEPQWTKDSLMTLARWLWPGIPHGQVQLLSRLPCMNPAYMKSLIDLLRQTGLRVPSYLHCDSGWLDRLESRAIANARDAGTLGIPVRYAVGAKRWQGMLYFLFVPEVDRIELLQTLTAKRQVNAMVLACDPPFFGCEIGAAIDTCRAVLIWANSQPAPPVPAESVGIRFLALPAQ